MSSEPFVNTIVQIPNGLMTSDGVGIVDFDKIRVEAASNGVTKVTDLMKTEVTIAVPSNMALDSNEFVRSIDVLLGRLRDLLCGRFVDSAKIQIFYHLPTMNEEETTRLMQSADDAMKNGKIAFMCVLQVCDYVRYDI